MTLEAGLRERSMDRTLGATRITCTDPATGRAASALARSDANPIKTNEDATINCATGVSRRLSMPTALLKKPSKPQQAVCSRVSRVLALSASDASQVAGLRRDRGSTLAPVLGRSVGCFPLPRSERVARSAKVIDR